MEYSKLYFDFIEGNLNLEEEQDFANKFAYDKEFLSGFKDYLTITNTISKNIKSYGPTINESNDLFAKLGYTYQPIVKTPKIKDDQHIIKSKNPILKYLATGIGSAIIGALMTLIFISPKAYKVDFHDYYNNNLSNTLNKSSNKNANFNKTNLIGQNDIPTSSNSLITKQIKNSIKKTDLLAGNFKNNINKKSIYRTENADIISTNPININKFIEISPISNESNILLVSNDFNKNNAGIDLKPIVTNRTSKIDSLTIIKENNELGLKFEFTGTLNWNLPKENITPYTISKFNNLGFAIHYDLSNNYSIGFGIRQETFYLKYSGLENISKFNYSQQPNLTSAGIVFRFNTIKLNNSDLFIQTEFDGNYYGFVSRALIGYKFNYDKNISFHLGAEYNTFFYNYQNQIFNSSKIGLNYGINFSLF